MVNPKRTTAPRPFTVSWSPDRLNRLKSQIRSYRFPRAPVDSGWTYGCDLDFLKSITGYWAGGYDFGAAQVELNRFAQFAAEVDGMELHFVHVVGEARGKRPLLITHGWPGSVYEFWGAIEKLAFPSRFGGDPGDAFDVVLPTLPGFGYSGRPARPIGQRATAKLFNTLMVELLGYDRYLAQGGDWGGLVTAWLGLDHADHVRAIHLNMIGVRPSEPPQSPEEIAWAQHSQGAMQAYGGYFMLQASKPQSLAYAMADNPVGQAAWILERFHDWSDLRKKPFGAVYSFDQLLTNIMLYVEPEAFTTSVWYYRGLFEEGGAQLPQGVKVEVPTAIATFPGEAIYKNPPRSYAERAYNLVRWSELSQGGHFACMEEPDLYIEEVRAFGRQIDQA